MRARSRYIRVVPIRLALHYDWRRLPSGEPPDALAALVEHAVAAEAQGFEVARIAERPGAPDSLLPAALPVCAAIAARTRRLRIGTGVLPLPLHQPLRVAEDAASLDALSGGRFELGVGLGADPELARRFGLAESPRAERLEEALAVIRAAWAEGSLDHAGGHFAVSGVEVWPKPIQRPGPPIWIGAGAPAAQRRAARLADGLLLPAEADPGPFLEAWRGSGRPLAEARVALPPIAEPTPPEAFDDWLRACAGVGHLDLVLAAGAPPEELAARAAPLLERIQDAGLGAAREDAPNLP